MENAVVKPLSQRVHDQSDNKNFLIVMDKMDDFNADDIRVDLFSDQRARLHLAVIAQSKYSDAQAKLIHKVRYETVVPTGVNEHSLKTFLETKDDGTKQLHLIGHKTQ